MAGHLAVEELLEDEQVLRLPLFRILGRRAQLKMERLVVHRVECYLALQRFHLEQYAARFLALNQG